MISAIVAALLCAAADPSAPVPEGAPAVTQPARARKKPGKPPMAGVVNVNRASEAELRLLPGIGKKRAQQIIDRRDKKPFASVDEVGRIKGLHALVQRLHSHLTVQGDTTLRPLRP
ncbi:MAG TPA: helix-hairpin-helix domain-containing protein [Myxococcales bacterium]|nr:helix-hairpin-helix domain-containing protein [Myxococcales bacterium]